MSLPTVELIPLRPAVRSDGTTGLDVLVRVAAPTSGQAAARPSVNLGLVLDNSRSMNGKKIDHARKAAVCAVDRLLATDRVSVTTFNSQVRTIVPNTFVTDKAPIVRQIEQVTTDTKTALHPGWVEGGRQVREHLIVNGINRVLILSDGIANQGKVDPAAIADEVRELAEKGVSTSTMGVGDKFNEDLLESMARAGGGNYHYIDSPDELPAFFQAELDDMMTTVGCRVSLGFEPVNGVTVSRVLNDFEANPSGQSMLPNVVAGRTIGVIVRLNVAARPETRPTLLCHVRLEWDAPEVSRSRRSDRSSPRSSRTGKTTGPRNRVRSGSRSASR